MEKDQNCINTLSAIDGHDTETATSKPPRRSEIEKEEWERLKNDILFAYRKADSTLKRTRALMIQMHGFDATIAQYKRQLKIWEEGKSIPAEVWMKVGEHVRKRKREGKDSHVLLHGEELESKRVRKEVNRYCPVRTVRTARSPSPLPTAFRLITPEPENETNTLVNTTPTRISSVPFLRFSALIEARKDAMERFLLHIPTPTVMKNLLSLLAPQLDNLHRQVRAYYIHETEKDAMKATLQIYSADRSGFEHILKHIVFLFSNNLASNSLIDELLPVIRAGIHNDHALISLLRSRLPTAIAFAETVFRSAIRRNDVDIIDALLSNTLVSADMRILYGASRTFVTVLEYAMLFRRVEAFDLLIKAGADVNARNIEGLSGPLFTAVRLGSCEFTQRLLDAKADVNIKAHRCTDSALQAALVTMLGKEAEDTSIFKDLVYILLEAGADVNPPWINNTHGFRVRSKFIGRTPLQSAAELNDFDLVIDLLRRGADVNAPPSPSSGRTALQACVRADNVVLVQELLRCGADVNAPAAAIHGATTLQAAQSFAMIQLLVENGADINGHPSKKYGRCCLQAPFMIGDLEAARYLISKGSRIDINPTIQSMTVSPLLAAIGLQTVDERKRLDLVRLALEAGADPNAEAARAGLGKFWHHSSESDEIIFEYEPGIETCTPLQLAVELSDVAIVQFLLAKGALANGRGMDYHILVAALISVHPLNVDILRLLLSHGLSLGVHAWEDGRLLAAAISDAVNVDLLKLLIAEGALLPFSCIGLAQSSPGGDFDNIPGPEQVLAPPETIEHALPKAIAMKNFAAIDILLAFSITSRDLSRASSPLGDWECDDCGLAAHEGFHNASPEHFRTFLNEALECAIFADNADMVRTFIDRGADPNALHKDVLRRIARHKNIRIMDLLWDGGYRISPLVQMRGTIATFLLSKVPTLEEWGALFANIEKLRQLADPSLSEGGHSVQAVGDTFCTEDVCTIVLAEVASVSRNIQLIKVLVDCGADVNGSVARTYFEDYLDSQWLKRWLKRPGSATILQLATLTRDNSEVIRYLVAMGANVNAEAISYDELSFKPRWTPLQIAVEMSDLDLVRYYISKGGAKVNLSGDFDYREGHSALSRAVELGFFAIVVLLLKSGASVNAAIGYNPETAYSNKDIKTYGIFTILEMSAQMGRLDIVQLLLDAAATGYYFVDISSTASLDRDFSDGKL
ncbi:ankyrin [Ascobolus immersus RN42]|uniref:Ankyrin n=1 Tax=Ascobolus immersus RN42 TaxID=1160509 RepID=A0A3N4I4Z5_ASCIM|nr:ankyrin [Ascobolus immersus RN42]